jgi:tetratricopeptide (TPR) repeat protein
MDRVIADFSEAVKLDPKMASGYYQGGNTYFEKRDWDRAIADFSKAIRYNPNYERAFYVRGLAYREKARVRPRDQRLQPGVPARSEERGAARQPRASRMKGDLER